MIRSIQFIVAALLATGTPWAQNVQAGSGLKAGKSAAGEISGLETRTHPIEMQTGQFASITLHHRGIDIIARVLAPDATAILKTPTIYHTSGPEAADFVAETTGIYHIEISAPYREPPGRYQIDVGEIRG